MAFTSLVKNMNERQLVECMRDGRMYTRQELAAAAGLSFPTAGKLVDELVERGMLLSLGIQESSMGGRKAGLYRMDGDFAHVLALFLQEKTVCYAVCDALGKEIYRQERKQREAQSAVMLMQDAIKDACKQDSRICAAVVGVPGGVHEGTVCYIDGYGELRGRELAGELAAYTGISVRISNNMNALAFGLAEKQAKKGSNAAYAASPGRSVRMGVQDSGGDENLVCIHLAGNGPGCGAVVNGRPVNGFCGFNGEIGFMPLFGDRTLQDVALSGFSGVSPGEYMGKMITCICTVLNPAQVILYLEQDWECSIEEIEDWCRKLMPAVAVPRLILADSYREDYLHGLKILALEMLFPPAADQGKAGRAMVTAAKGSNPAAWQRGC